MWRRSWFLFLVLFRGTAGALAGAFSSAVGAEVVLVGDAVAVAVTRGGRVDRAEHEAEAGHGDRRFADRDRATASAEERDVAREERRGSHGEQPFGGRDRFPVR